MANIELLLIDDDIELANMLNEYLQQQGFQVHCAHDGKTGFELAQQRSFDLILLDVMLPEMDGFTVLRQLRQQQVMTPIIMLTARGDDFDRIFGLELGADDYLAKPFNHRELVARIHAITRRIEQLQQQSQATKQLQCNGVTLDIGKREVLAAGQSIAVTGTEFEILQLLVKHVDDIISKEQISKDVLGRRLAAFDRSIDMHVSNLRKKLGQHLPHEVIRTVRGAGYIFMSGG